MTEQHTGWYRVRYLAPTEGEAHFISADNVEVIEAVTVGVAA